MRFILLIPLLFLSGCAELNFALNSGSALRDSTAKKEMLYHKKRLCSSNGDQLLDEFGGNAEEWRSFLIVCGRTSGTLPSSP